MINPDPNMGAGSRSSSDIESDIRRTRGRMDATLDALGSQLTARSVLHTILDMWEGRQGCTPQSEVRTEKVYGALTTQVANQVRENPIPTLLIGAGIAWMFMDRNSTPDNREYVEMSGRRYRVRPSTAATPVGGIEGAPVAEYQYENVEYDEIDHGPGLLDRAKEKLAQGKDAITGAAAAAKDRITGAAGAVRGRAGEFGDVTRDRVGGLGEAAHSTAEQVRERARQAYYRGRSGTRQMGRNIQDGYATGAERFQDAVEETPLGVGLGFAALGILVGLVLPHTRREDELLGERSDELLDTVKERGREALERGKNVAGRVAETALEEAQRQGLTAAAAGETLTQLAAKAGEVAKRVKEEATSAVQEEKSGMTGGTNGGVGISTEDTVSTTSTYGSGDAFGTSGATGTTGSFGSGQSVTMPPKGASGTGTI